MFKAHSIELFQDSWPKVVISKTKMVPEENQSGEENSMMKTWMLLSTKSIFLLWQTLVQTPTEVNSLLLSKRPHISTVNTPSSENLRKEVSSSSTKLNKLVPQVVKLALQLSLKLPVFSEQLALF